MMKFLDVIVDLFSASCQLSIAVLEEKNELMKKRYNWQTRRKSYQTVAMENRNIALKHHWVVHHYSSPSFGTQHQKHNCLMILFFDDNPEILILTFLGIFLVLYCLFIV